MRGRLVIPDGSPFPRIACDPSFSRNRSPYCFRSASAAGDGLVPLARPMALEPGVPSSRWRCSQATSATRKACRRPGPEGSVVLGRIASRGPGRILPGTSILPSASISTVPNCALSPRARIECAERPQAEQGAGEQIEEEAAIRRKLLGTAEGFQGDLVLE